MKIFLFYCLSFSLGLASLNDTSDLNDRFTCSYYQNYIYNNVQSQINYHQYIVNPITGIDFSSETKQISHIALTHLLDVKLKNINMNVWQVNHKILNSIPVELYQNQIFIDLINKIFNSECLIDRRQQNFHFFNSMDFINNENKKNIRNTGFSYQALVLTEQNIICSIKKMLYQYYFDVLYMMGQALNHIN